MSPEDKEAIIAFAGPLFAEAKFIDANSIDKDGYPTSRHAQEIQNALERDFTRSPARVHQPQHVVDYGQYQMPQPNFPPIPQVHPQPYYPQPQVDNGQLEFAFDQSEQQKTNSLLEDISRKLTKLISMLQDKDKPKENVTKLKVAKEDLPKSTGGFVQDK